MVLGVRRGKWFSFISDLRVRKCGVIGDVSTRKGRVGNIKKKSCGKRGIVPFLTDEQMGRKFSVSIYILECVLWPNGNRAVMKT